MSTTSRKWFFNGTNVVSIGQSQPGVSAEKYTEAIEGNDIILTVHSFGISDNGTYSCRNGFYISQSRNVFFECKYNNRR